MRDQWNRPPSNAATGKIASSAGNNKAQQNSVPAVGPPEMANSMSL